MVGLAVIWTVFQTLNPVFLSANNLVNLLFDCSTVGVISLGIVCILMVGEIDLSVGSVSGFASAILGVLWVNADWPVAAAIVVALVAGGDRGRSTPCCSTGWACRASSRRWPDCSPCSGCSSMSWGRAGRSTCPTARRWWSWARRW